MGFSSIWHWVIVLAVVVLLFGAKKIPELAKGIGTGIKVFKKSVKDEEDETQDFQESEEVTKTKKTLAQEKPKKVSTRKKTNSKASVAETTEQTPAKKRGRKKKTEEA